MDDEFEESLSVLTLAFHRGIIIEEQFVLFVHALEEDLLRKAQRERTFGPRLDIQKLEDEQCQLFFRFKYDELLRLKDALHIQDTMRAPNGTKWSGLEGLCVLLRRLSYPNRLRDLEVFFGRGVTDLGIIANFICLQICHQFDRLLSDFANQPWFTAERLARYCAGIAEKCDIEGVEGLQLWGFIDGTVRRCCRPIRHQNLLYNGYKKVHCLKFQTVVTPDGMIASLFGPMEGKRHDAAVLRESHLVNYIRQNIPAFHAAGHGQLYGDSAYPLCPEILTPFKHHVTPDQQLFNTTMSGVRMSVEWGYKEICTHFAFVDFHKNMKVLLQPVGAYYRVATLLTNCLNCLCRNQTSRHFGIEPPELEDYLQ